MLLFYEYYLNPSLSIVLTKVLINLCFSVFPLLINHAYPFQLIFPKWIFYHSNYHLCFQCHPPQFVPILCAHSALVLISQQKSEYLVRLFALLFFPVYSLQALTHTVLPHLKCPIFPILQGSCHVLCPPWKFSSLIPSDLLSIWLYSYLRSVMCKIALSFIVLYNFLAC